MGLFGPNVEKMEKNRDVNGLVRALKHKDVNVVGGAARALIGIGPPAVESLIHALRDEDPRVRIIAVSILGRIGDARAVEPLVGMFRDQFFKVGEEAVSALAAIGEPAVETVIRALQDMDPIVRYLAVDALKSIGSKRAVEPLIQAQKDGNRDVRSAVAVALGTIGDPRAVDALSQALRDEDKGVRFEAAKALVKVGEPTIPFVKAFENGDIELRKKLEAVLGELGWMPKNPTEQAYYWIATRRWELLTGLGKDAVEPLLLAMSHYDLRNETMKVLGKIGDTRAIDPIIQVALSQYNNWGIVGQSVSALTEMAMRDIGPIVHALQNKDGRVQGLAARVLGEVHDISAVEPLLQALETENYEARSRVIEALGKIGDARVVEPLIRELKHPYWGIRKSAIEVLNNLNDTTAFQPLIQTIKDDNKDIRKIAIKTLMKLLKTADLYTQHIEYHTKGLQKKAEVELLLGPLIQALKDPDNDVRKEAALALGEISDLRAAEAMIEWLFMFGAYGSFDAKSQVSTWTKLFRGLFGDYTTLILRAALHINSNPRSTSDTNGVYDYNMHESDMAIQELCSIHTQIATNILHKISERRDVQVSVSWDCSTEYLGTLSFESQREMARNELARRSNPSYDPSVYLNPEAWKASAH